MSGSTRTLPVKTEKQLKLDEKLLYAFHARVNESLVYKLLEEGANPKNLEERIPEFSASPLHYAARHGWYNIIKLLIEEYKCNPIISDSTLDTPLHYACRNGHVDIARLLIEKYKCEVNCQNISGLTPLQVTNLKLHLIIKLLVLNEADPHVVDNDGNSLLHKACQLYSLESIKCLLELGKCDPNVKNKAGLTPIQVTSPESSDILRELVQHGANPNVVDNDGNTPLHKACDYGKLQSVKYLLEEGKCDPNIKNTPGLTPIQVTFPESSDIIKELVRHGANLNIVDSHGNTPLHNVCNVNYTKLCLYKYNCVQSIKCLLEEEKCDPNIKNKAGLTPIQVTDPGSSDIIRELVQHGANPNIVDSDGNTPLHKACKFLKLESVKCLLEEGKCDPNIKNKAGLTPIQIRFPGTSEIMSELVEHGANLNLVYKDGNTLLHIACNLCELQSVKCLLEKGKCDPNVKDKAGLTPIQVTSPLSSDIMRELIQYDANLKILDNYGNTPLHNVCKYDLSSYNDVHLNRYYNLLQTSIRHILQDGKCDPNVKNKAGLTPLQVTSPESSVIMKGLIQHGAKPNVIDNDVNTPLHKACEFSCVESVKCLLEEGKCDPNIKNKAGLTPIQVTSPDFPDIIRELIRHGANSTGVYQTFGNVLKSQKPLEPPVKVFIVGNPSTGKSTLTESLKNESNQLLGRFLKVSGVDAKTAGINPHEFRSKKYGLVTFYDFAGQRSYYSSHAAVLRNSIQSSPIFIIVIDLLCCNEDIKKDLAFWLSFLSNQICCLENKPHVIVVGSHADAVNSGGEQAEQKMSRVVESLPPISDFTLVEAIPLDCRYPSSSGMTKLHQCLSQSCDALRIHHTINFNAHCFFIYLLENFGKMIAMTVKEIKSRIIIIESNLCLDAQKLLAFIPTTLQGLCAVLDELNDRGHILYLKDHSITMKTVG